MVTFFFSGSFLQSCEHFHFIGTYSGAEVSSDSQVLGPRDPGSASSRFFVLWHTSRRGNCCGLNIFVPTDLYVDALTPNVMVFGRSLGGDKVMKVEPP